MYNIYFSQVNYEMGAGNFKGYYLPYSAGSIWSYARQVDWVVNNFVLKEFFFKRDDPKEVVEKLDNPSIFCFSTYIWNVNYHTILAREVKKKYPKCLIVFGGPQINESFLKKHKFVDSVALGEGEINFLKILDDFINSKVKPVYSFSRVEDLDFPSPHTSGVFDQLLQDNPDIKWNTVFETNRGCPFKCTFCDWGSLTYQKLKKFTLDRLFDELEWFGKNKIRFVAFADANFGVFKERDNAIAEKLISVQNKYGFPESVDTSWYKNLDSSTLAIAKKFVEHDKNRGLSLSLQSLNSDTLSAVERGNMKMNKLSAILEECNSMQLPTYTEIILGLPDETLQSWKEGLCEIVKAGQHNSIESYLLVILENSQLNKQKDIHELDLVKVNNYFTSNDFRILEDTYVVRGTKTLPFNELVQAYMFSWLIINFHTYGWTQIYSIFMYKKFNIDYLEFYNKLLAYILSSDNIISSEYFKTKEKISDFLSGKLGLTESGFSIMWDSQVVFHEKQNNTDIKKFLLNFMETNFPINLDLYKAQQAFTSELDVITSKVSLDSNIFEYVFKGEDLSNISKEYELTVKFLYESSEDYFNMFYFRRRHGWGKRNILNFQ
jgi:radical SAM superfamily enzyme YgiQ (UPF0313 family)